MKRAHGWMWTLAIVASVAIAVGANASTEATPQVESGPAPVDAPENERKSPRRDTPLNREIEQLMTAESSAVEELRLAIRHASTDAERVQLQQQIAQRKQATEVHLMRIQAKHARLDGHVAAAAEMDEIVAELETKFEKRFGRKVAPTQTSGE